MQSNVVSIPVRVMHASQKVAPIAYTLQVEICPAEAMDAGNNVTWLMFLAVSISTEIGATP